MSDEGTILAEGSPQSLQPILAQLALAGIAGQLVKPPRGGGG